MNTFLPGVLLWMLAAAAAAACARLLKPERPRAIGIRLVWAACLLGAVVFLFRPEEEMTSGDDPAAYLNMALTMARRGQFVYQDPGLAAVPAGDRPLFRYGHAGFGFTKDHCFCIKDVATAEVAPWFQPAFSVLLSIPVALGWPYAAFWVTPLFTILLAWLLAGMARRVTGRETWAVLAFMLFLLHPVMAWNGRCLRPEIPAAFLVLSGILILTVDRDRGQPGGWSGFVSGAAFSGAILLHITAVYVVGPAMVMAAWRTRRNRCWIGWWLGLTVGLLFLAAQTVWITDPYGLTLFWRRPERRPWVIGAGMLFVGGLAFLAVRPYGARMMGRLRRCAVPQPDRPSADPVGTCTVGFTEGAGNGLPGLPGGGETIRRAVYWPGVSLAAVYGVVVLWIFFARDPQGLIPGFPQWMNSYLSLTDFRGITLVSTRLWSLTALVGVVCLCGRLGTRGTLGRRWFVLLAPATLAIGWMVIYMFETRRALIALIPLMILGTVALLNTVEEGLAYGIRRIVPAGAGGRGRRLIPFMATVASLLAAMVLTGAAMRGRLHLYSLWNRRGTYLFYRDVARQVARDGDFLFAEYTQTAAPIEHLTGLPMLPLAWGYRSDKEYRHAEIEMARLVKEHPERRHLLVTPFSGYALPGVAMEPLASHRFETRVLERVRQRLPSRIHQQTRSLQVVRLLPDGRQDTSRDDAVPTVRMMDGSRMGLDGVANFMSHRQIEIQGLAIEPESDLSVSLAPPEGESVVAERLVLVFAVPSGAVPDQLRITIAGMELTTRRGSLCPGWETIDILGALPDTVPLLAEVTSSETVWLTDVLASGSAHPEPRRWMIRNPVARLSLAGIDSQWILGAANVALPSPPAPAWLWILATAGREDGIRGTLTVRPPDRDATVATVDIGEGWGWHVLPLPAAGAVPGIYQWYEWRVDPSWDPGIRGFPPDLGLRIHAVVIRPAGPQQPQPPGSD